jgi:hypothetical protein
MRKLAVICAALGAMTLAACDTTSPVAQYTPSTSNILAIQSSLRPTNTTVQVGDFTADPTAVKPGCRLAGGLDVTAGKTLEEYMKDALQSELFAAGAYDVKSPNVISGRLTLIRVNTFGTGAWTLGMDVKSNSSAGYHVEVTRPFASSYMATAACQNAVNAFAPTVQALFASMIADPGFTKLARH